ncbi:hypothetical protein EBB79_11425 [Parasedimentitalea marina]|uniref:Uncharacterized protein n=1 Tax=Parasedimentitalea marina TaxID=2483033 RepID=A0A3T0N337_9RHOB|nr:hypothetical protein [Parasedimentitalea marina]AZV78430.1 hypothetical protein EBB79_11425 [Parasedimentitalea marina]
MKKLFGAATASMMSISTSGLADGYYDLFGSHGDKWGELTFEETVGEYTHWIWPNEEGQESFFIYNPTGGRDGWSGGTYDGYFTVDMPEEILRPCGTTITDAFGYDAREWGSARMEWISSDEFILQKWRCNGTSLDLQVVGRYAWDQSTNEPVVPIAARLSLQSDNIPLSVDDPAYTVQGLDKNPAIYLDVNFSDGTSGDYEYKKFSASNIMFDDVSGDPNDIIQINYWDIDSNNPGLGQYAAQLTSTGNGVGTAELLVSFRDAPYVTASVTATVVSAIPQVKTPVSAALALQSYTLPLSRRDRAYTVSQLDLFPAIYVTAQFEDGTSVDHFYQKDFADNVIVDDVSGDPYDLIEIVQWPVFDNNPHGPQFAGQLTSTGRGTGTANLLLSFINAPGVTASIAVTVVSGAN